MKRIITLFALLFAGGAMQAQVANEAAPAVKPITVSLGNLPHAASHKGPGTTPSAAALWDIQEYFAVDTVASTAGSFAGIAWVGNEWWVSQWNKDSVFTIDVNGNLISAFKITGVGAPASGVRSMTYDGTNLYMADNTTTIKVVNPVTKTLSSTINVSSVGFNARAITYSQAINGGAGGFYIANFGNAIAEVSLTGTVLNTIPAATHTLTGIYGLAYDDLTFGGPFLWAFDQGSAGTGATLVRLDLPSGTPTFVQKNVNADIGVLANTGIAGGMFITDSYVPGKFTIAGMLQGTPLDILFAYELDSITQIPPDGGLARVEFTPRNTLVPNEHMSPITFPVVAENNGGSPVTINATVTVSSNGTNIGTYTGSSANVPSGSPVTITTTGSLTPTAFSTYSVQAQIGLTGQVDSDPTNDSVSFTIAVTDTTFALDNGQISGGLGFGAGVNGSIGQIYTLNTSDVITTVTVAFNTPPVGDSTRVVVHGFTNAPTTLIGRSAYYTFTAADTGVVVLDLPVTNLLNSALSLSSGTYLFGIEETGEGNVSLATSEFNWRPSTCWVALNPNPWSPIENFNFNRVGIVRPNTGNSFTSLADVPELKSLNVFPNPATAELRFRLEGRLVKAELMDLRGSVLRSEVFESPVSEGVITLAGLPVGIYQLRAIDTNGVQYVNRIVKQ